MVVEAFNDIERFFQDHLKLSPISSTDASALLLKLKKRREETLTATHFAANLLDPKHKGASLTDAENLLAVECIIEMGDFLRINKSVLYEEIGQFKTKSGLWSGNFIWDVSKGISNTTWWSGMCAQKELHKISLRVLSLPASSAASERSFSTHGFIHNKLRNRLDTERAAKIVYIAHNMKIKTFNENHSDLNLQDEDPKPSTCTSPCNTLTLSDEDDENEDDHDNNVSNESLCDSNASIL